MTDSSPTEITRLLGQLGTADRDALDALLPQVLSELRKLAAAQFADERRDHTLQPTALVNEAYLRLTDSRELRITSRGHFFRLASKIMRQILIDHARARLTEKRGGGGANLTLCESLGIVQEPAIDLLALEDALDRLARFSEDQARLVELRFYGGLTIEEAADALGISRTRAIEDWRAARAWLADELRGSA